MKNRTFEYMNYYHSCECKLSSCENEAIKNSGLNGIRAHDFYDTDAVLLPTALLKAGFPMSAKSQLIGDFTVSRPSYMSAKSGIRVALIGNDRRHF